MAHSHNVSKKADCSSEGGYLGVEPVLPEVGGGGHAVPPGHLWRGPSHREQ